MTMELLTKNNPDSTDKNLNRLKIGFSIIMLLMFIPIIIGIYGMSIMYDSLEDITTNQNFKKYHLYLMRDKIRKRQVLLREILLENDPFVQDELRIKFYDNAAGVAASRNKLMEMKHSKEEEKLFVRIRQSIKNAYPLQNNLIDEILFSQKKKKDVKERMQIIFNAQAEVLRDLDGFIMLQEKQSIESARSASSLFSNSFMVLVFIAILSTICGTFLAIYVVRVNRKQENTVKSVLEKLKASHHYLEEKVEERTRDLVLARDAALVAERSMSTFLANMSHELRTPLHGILGFSNFGLRKINRVPKEKLETYFSEIKASGDYLLTLVNNLLDLSKLRAGEMNYNFDEYNLTDVTHDIIKELLLIAEEKGNKIHFVNENKKYFHVFDKERILQVIRNLLFNAIKYNIPDSIINISITRNSDESLTLDISDQGVGIPEDELDYIFGAFIQSSTTKTTAGGTGLGLSICKEIIEVGHNGTLTAKNNPTGGATFQFSLPKKAINASNIIAAVP